MASYAEAKAAAEKAGTEKAGKFRPRVQKFLWYGTIALVLVCGTLVFKSYTERPAELRAGSATSPATPALRTLSMPPHGDSPRIAAEKGIAPAFTGYNFETHCVYADGRDLSYAQCVPGNIIAYYVRDLSGKPNTVTYKLVSN